MPLARIITKSADDSLELSMQLRSRGFRVETVAPGHIPTVPADLEVCLEECAPEEVLTKAAVAQESEDLWVFVAPGALDERSRPMRVIPLTPQVVEISAREHAAAVAALIAQVEVPAVEVKLFEVQRKTHAEVQVPAVLVKEVVLAPEDEPLLCEIEAQATAAMNDLPVSRIADISTSVPFVIAESVVAVPSETKLVETTPLPREIKVQAAPAPVEVKLPAEVVLKSKPTPSKPTPENSLERVKKLAVVQQVASQIPTVPERVEPKIVLYKPAPPKPTRRGPWKSYKVAFQSGPRLWRTASVTLALIVLAGLVATVVAVRPTLPKKVTSSPNPAIFLPMAQASTAEGSTNAHAAAATSAATTLDAQRSGSHRSSVSDDGLIAKDTVIFYNHKPSPPRQTEAIAREAKPVAREAKLPTREARPPAREAKLPPPPPSGVKRYSDVN